MDGLVVWEIQDRKILRVDYGQNTEDPAQLLRAVIAEHYKTEEETCYSLIDFAYKDFPRSFVDEYKVLAAEISGKKVIISAYLGLLPELYSAAAEVLAEVKCKEKEAWIAFFESEAAAIEWLLSFNGSTAGGSCE